LILQTKKNSKPGLCFAIYLAAFWSSLLILLLLGIRLRKCLMRIVVLSARLVGQLLLAKWIPVECVSFTSVACKETEVQSLTLIESQMETVGNAAAKRQKQSNPENVWTIYALPCRLFHTR
jgi:hypothetical protein